MCARSQGFYGAVQNQAFHPHQQHSLLGQKDQEGLGWLQFALDSHQLTWKAQMCPGLTKPLLMEMLLNAPVWPVLSQQFSNVGRILTLKSYCYLLQAQ